MPTARAVALRQRTGFAALDRGSYRSTNPERARTIVRDGAGTRHADDASRRLARELARSLDRDGSVYRAIVTAFLDLVIGKGVMPVPETEDPEWNQKACELFLAEACGDGSSSVLDVEGCDTYAALQRKWARAVVNDGDLLLVKLTTDEIATVEADRVDGRRQGLNARRAVSGGIYYDPLTGRRLEYAVAPYGSGSMPRPDRAQWYPADQVVYCGTSSRKSQLRSLPALVASLDDAERADSLLEASVITAEQASLIWGFLSDRDNRAGLTGGLDPLAALNADGTTAIGGKSDTGEVRWQDFIAGSLAKLGNREFKQAQTALPNTKVTDFLTALIRIFAAELGVPYELALLDVGKLSWSGNKALLAFSERRHEVWRCQVFGPLFSSIYRWRVARWIQQGKLPQRADWSKHSHAWPRPPEVDGPDQVTTDKGNLALGRTSLHRLVGPQWSQILREQAIEQQLRDQFAVDRIVAVEAAIAAAAAANPTLTRLAAVSWPQILTLGGADSAPGAYLAAAGTAPATDGFSAPGADGGAGGDPSAPTPDPAADDGVQLVRDQTGQLVGLKPWR